MHLHKLAAQPRGSTDVLQLMRGVSTKTTVGWKIKQVAAQTQLKSDQKFYFYLIPTLQTIKAKSKIRRPKIIGGGGIHHYKYLENILRSSMG